MPSLWQRFKAKISNPSDREETAVHAPDAPRREDEPAQAPQDHIYGRFVPRNATLPSNATQLRGEIYANVPRVQPNAPAQQRGEIYANVPKVQPNAPAPRPERGDATRGAQNAERAPRDHHGKVPDFGQMTDTAPARTLPDARQRVTPARQPKDNHAKIPVILGAPKVLAEHSTLAGDHGERRANTVQRVLPVDRGRKH
jgi:hypothetical protein